MIRMFDVAARCVMTVRTRWFIQWTILVIATTGATAALGAMLSRSATHAVASGDMPSLHDGRHGGVLLGGAVLDFTPHGTQPLAGVPGMEAPDGCSGCHRYRTGSPLSPTAGEYMPDNTWGGSMMAHATRDPLFWAALDVANADVPGVGDYCLKCHTPVGWLSGRVSKTQGGGVIDGANGCFLTGDHDDRETKGNDYNGLTCHFCHRLQEAPADDPAPFGNGNFFIDNSTQCVTDTGETFFEPCRGGPYQYTADSETVAPHAWKYSAFHDRGAICGTCHDVSTPDVRDPDTGVITPLKTLVLPDGSDSEVPMPIERTFTEWRQSDFSDLIFRDRMGDGFDFEPQLAHGATCQDCHMASSEDPTAQACTVSSQGYRTGDLPVHEFVGANTWVPAIIKGEFALSDDSGLASRVADIDHTIRRARDMLTTRSARIETTVAQSGGDQLTASVKVTNLAGHKLPTGYAEGRRMWLHVQARDAADTVVWENGTWDPATGELLQDGQTRIYETLQGIWNPATSTCEVEDAQGRKMFHFVLNDCIAKDNRIPPLGFDGASSVETRPVAHPYPVVPGSEKLVNFDVAIYAIDLPPGTAGPVTVTATLNFQIASDDYIEFLKNQSDERNFEPENTMCSTGPGRPFDIGPQDKTRGQYMYDLWTDPAYGRSPPEAMVSHSASLTLIP
jgi:hypothetical protein